jgi:hypothetical protein
MNTSTTKHAKNTLVYSTLFLPALSVALWAGTLSGAECFLAILAAIGLALGAFCFLRRKDDLVHDFFLPILLFAALGAMSWAVRGSSGFGSAKGCIFAGVLWGAAWWFIARNPTGPPARRYASGWVILALAIGIGLSGARGWAQWSNFFAGELQTSTDPYESVPIVPIHGFVWLFIAGMPWAGIGACLLAWSGAEKPLAAWQWSVRLFCAFGGAFFASWLFATYPQWFLPLYSTMKDRYADATANPNLQRVINDNGAAIRHLGFYLGCLLFEFGRRDWKNVTLIGTVGLVNGIGWSLLQNWHWSKAIWPTMENYWRAWESSGGISIGIALGIAYYLVNRRTVPCACAKAPAPAGFPIFGVCSMIFMSVILLWYVVANAGSLFSADWAAHLPFCAVLLYGLGLYFWRLRATLVGTAESSESAIPKLGTWAIHFGLMALVALFMMGPLEFFGTPDPATPWWARFDYLFVGATGLYGVLFFLTALWKTLTVRPEEKESIAPFFQRYPNLDWMAIYLFLTIIACSFLRGEIPGWKGWLWIAQETPAPWTGSLGLACLVLFGVVWCALSYFSPREGEGGLDRFAVHLGLLLGLGLSLKNGTRGWANKNLDGNEHMWGDLYWRYIGPAMLLLLVGIIALALMRRVMAPREGDSVPHAWAFIVLVIVVQNAFAHLVTGPITNWNEAIFNLYYVLLFFLTATILYHYHFIQTWAPFLVAGIEGDDDEALEAAETSEPSGAIANDLAEEPMVESAETTDEEIVEATDDEALVEEPPVQMDENEVVTDEVAEGTVASQEARSSEEEFEAAPEAETDGEKADAADVVMEEPEAEVGAEEEEAPETPNEAIEAVYDNDEADLDGTPMFDDDELPTEPLVDEDRDGEPGPSRAS